LNINEESPPGCGLNSSRLRRLNEELLLALVGEKLRSGIYIRVKQQTGIRKLVAWKRMFLLNRSRVRSPGLRELNQHVGVTVLFCPPFLTQEDRYCSPNRQPYAMSD